jgi:hypothetical protein
LYPVDGRSFPHLLLDAAPVCCFLPVNRLLQFAASAAGCCTSLVAFHLFCLFAGCGVSLAFPVDGCSLPHASLGATFAFCVLLMGVVCRICCWMQRLFVVSFLLMDCCSLPRLPLDAASVWCGPLMDVVCHIGHWMRQSGGISR